MTTIAGYDNLEVIGQGGFAVVYRARQISVGRNVAIKLLSDPAPDEDLVRRFRRESQAVGALSWHPHIAAVVDAGTTELGQAYIVFELLHGGSLEDKIETGPMPWHAAVAAMIQVADAVEAAHHADVLHRDIKPANILVDRLGVAKLGDFGIASMQDGNKTETGMLATTVAHAAPELFDGHTATAATDVYAIGSTLHTLLSGNPPFNPPTGERIATTIGRISNEPPPQLNLSVVPEAVATATVHALAKQPQYRPRSAAAFGKALQDAQRAAGEAVTAMPFSDALPTTDSGTPVASPTTERVPFSPNGTALPATEQRSAGHFRKVVALLAVAAVLLAAFLVGVLVFDARRGPVATTAGGVEIAGFTALDATAMAAFPADHAVDQNEATYWGVTRASSGENIIGTTFVLRLSEQTQISQVGISSGEGSSLGRVAEVRWATSVAELRSQAETIVRQTIPDGAGATLDHVDFTTDMIVLMIADVHGDAENIGIAEILLVTQ